MGKSSIAKQLGRGPSSATAVELGERIRRRRIEVGLTQSALGAPLSKGFVSAVEHGRALPSLGALCLFADRLEVSLGVLLQGVNRSATG